MTPITEVQRLITTRTAVRQEILVNPGNRYLEYVSASGQMIRLPNVIREFDPSWEDVPAPAADTAILGYGNDSCKKGPFALNVLLGK
jgi:hypothetical protein